MNLVVKEVLSLVLQGGAAGAVATGLFKLFLDRRLETFKTSQAKELEGFKASQAEKLARVSVLFEKERDALNETWLRIMRTNGAVSQLASSWIWLPDLDRLGPDEFDHFLSTIDFPEYMKNELRQTDRKYEKYSVMDFQRRLREAERETRELNNYIVTSRFYLERGIREKSTELFKRFHQVCVHAKIQFQHPEHGPRTYSEKADKTFEECQPLVGEIGDLIESRFKVDPEGAERQSHV